MFDRIQNSEVRILYAEDTDAQRYAVSRVLQNAGFQVIEASTGQQALEQMSCRPDLVILDVKLPDISGLEVCRQIKSTEATASVPGNDTGSSGRPGRRRRRLLGSTD